MAEGVIAIICPESRSAAHAVMDICQQHAIPCITAHWDYLLNDTYTYNMTVNLHPTAADIGGTLVTFLEKCEGWDDLGLLFTEEESK